MLTDTKVRNAKPQPKPYKLFDANRLFLLVTPGGGKLCFGFSHRARLARRSVFGSSRSSYRAGLPCTLHSSRDAQVRATDVWNVAFCREPTLNSARGNGLNVPTNVVTIGINEWRLLERLVGALNVRDWGAKSL